MKEERKRILLSWSSGKDSAWALHLLRQRFDVEVAGLLTTINEQFDRVAMHAVRTDLLRRQAESVGLPLRLISLPFPCSNEVYEERLRAAIDAAQSDGIEGVAFGDLFLADVRQYRERMMEGTGIAPLFPLWGRPTDQLAGEMIDGGLRAQITCIDPRHLPTTLAGREYNGDFLKALPDGLTHAARTGNSTVSPSTAQCSIVGSDSPREIPLSATGSSLLIWRQQPRRAFFSRNRPLQTINARKKIA